MHVPVAGRQVRLLRGGLMPRPPAVGFGRETSEENARILAGIRDGEITAVPDED